MGRRQTMPRRWLIVRSPDDYDGIAAAMRLQRDTGVLLLQPLARADLMRLRRRGLTVVLEEGRAAARVHDVRELRRALLDRTPLILLSPLYRSRTHPEWKPMPRMRAAALARLGRRTVFALGGMDARKFARIKTLGFHGWAGISAFRT